MADLCELQIADTAGSPIWVNPEHVVTITRTGVDEMEIVTVRTTFTVRGNIETIINSIGGMKVTG